jgi:hypothetical protein
MNTKNVSQVSVEHSTYITQNTTTYIIETITIYYKLNTTSYLYWVLLDLSTSRSHRRHCRHHRRRYSHRHCYHWCLSARRLDVILGVHGSDGGKVVQPSSPKKSTRPRLPTNLSSEVLTWFIDNSSEETSSSIFSSSSSVSSSYESKELLSLPSSSESHSLFLTVEVSTPSSILCLLFLSLDAILFTREKVERERVIGWTKENVADVSAIWGRWRKRR